VNNDAGGGALAASGTTGAYAHAPGTLTEPTASPAHDPRAPDRTARELAWRVGEKIEDTSSKRDGEVMVACPIQDHITHFSPVPDGDMSVWCDGGECDPRDVEDALWFLVDALPDICTESRFEFGHAQTCPRCLLYAAAARPAYQEVRRRFPPPGLDQASSETARELARIMARDRAQRIVAAQVAAEFEHAVSGNLSEDEEAALLGRFTPRTPDDIRNQPVRPDIVEGVIGPPGTLNQINGYRDSMKSLLTLGLAGAIGGEMPTAYGLDVNEYGHVLYLYLEGAQGLSRRLDAWEDHHGRQMQGVTFLHDPIDMKQPGDVRALAVFARRLDALVIVLDSVAKTGGGKEDAEDFGAYRLGMETLRDATGAAVVALHNSGHDKSRGRGHTTLIDGMDSAVLLRPMSSKDGGGVLLQDEKGRDTGALAEVRLRFDPCGPLNPRKGAPWSGVVVRQGVDETLTTVLAAHAAITEKALAAINEHGGEITSADLAVALDVPRSDLARTVRPLLDGNVLITNGRRTTALRYLLGPEAR